MLWNDLDGSVLLRKVFTKPVEISLIDLFSIKIDREGPTVVIEFDLVGQLPDNPPPKWGNGYNRCRCGLNCGGVKSVSMNGIAPNMLAEISIEKNGEINKLIISSEKASLVVECSHLQLMGPSVYISE
ncbi:Imm50 family immunity protein [Paraburkholderia xenovorans]